MPVIVPQQQRTVNDVLGNIYRMRIEGDASLLYLVQQMEGLAQQLQEKCAECDALKRKYEPEENKKDA